MIQPYSRPTHHALTRIQPRTASNDRNTPTGIFADQISRSLGSASKAVPSSPAILPPTTGGNILPPSPLVDTAPKAIPTAPASLSTAAGSMFGQPPGTPGADTLNAMSQLSSALKLAGIDPDSFGMVAHDDVAGYPGGSYTNHLITLNAGGHVENFMADLTAINPNVAVTEIKHLLGMG